MDQQYPSVAKIPVLDIGKFEQWQFQMQQYLQHEHYALWEVIEFRDFFEAPANDPSTTTTNTTSGEAGTKSGRTVTLTTEDMQKKKNDVKARTTLLLSLRDEHQLRFSQLQFMDVEVEHDDHNQKFLTSLAPEWLMHTIVWRNRSDLNTMSLDDLYNHLKLYETEVQKKTEPNIQKMAFISLAKHSMGNDEVNTASVYTASSNVPTASANVATDWSYMANDEEDHALVADEEAPTEFALMANTSTESKVFDNSLCSKDCKKNNDSLNKSRLVEYKEREVKYIEIRTIEYYHESTKECIETLKKELENLKQEKEVVDGKLAGLLTASKDLENHIESQRLDKSKEGLGYTAVPPPPAQLYLSSKKDLSWTGLPECADDTVTNYSRPSPTVESSSEEDQNRNHSVSENVASPITPKQAVPRIILMTKAIGTVAALGGCKITRKGTIKTGKHEFENVYFVKDLKDFKLLDDANISLRTPKQHNMYSIDLNNIVPHRDLTCLVAKASADECMIWHGRL
nr:hypothetical protein [Tanacetum cinerariifolium]